MKISLSFLLLFISSIGIKNKFSDPVPGSCTIFSASIGNQTLFGNNEDYFDPDTYLWTEPATRGNYGCIYLGFKDYSHQGGINEKGLCFDANALPDVKINLHKELLQPPHYDVPYDQYEIWLPVLILRRAATIQEAIDIAQKYQKNNWYPSSDGVGYQLNFADAQGDAVVMSVDQSGELAFTRKNKDAYFLISTNYNKANPNNALEYPCHRYTVSEEMLSTITKENDITVSFFKNILDRVHQEGIFSRTLYSNIFDLQRGIIYLYYQHEYEEVVILHVKDELAKGNINIKISDLFSEETVHQASYKWYSLIAKWILGCAALTVISILIIHYINKKYYKFH
ncbi:hypothetical protein [Flammeovirga sp. SubArs3]|uniref:hypothetical protein n=1 Tax=Flammeovirga sp. SubArs3 TaxID=2995316 RepID=UPI00248CDAC0|nr:hypothetical protein [Flammeovirga sp. SubArs3]